MSGPIAAGLFGVLLAGIFCTNASADAYFVKFGGYGSPGIRTSENTGQIAITGEITEGDAAFFDSHSIEFRYKEPEVFLNSPGGDVHAAMKIGRIIRSVDGMTAIFGRCYSSCALIYIAGVTRINSGELGIHRPYFSSTPLSREQIEKQVPIVRSAVKTYVREMGITETFFEQMFNTEPAAVKIYRDNTEEIVPFADPTYDEIQASHFAQEYGLTTSEYRKRELLARSCITEANFKPDCYQSIMWGLPTALYRTRWALAKAKCELSQAELKLLRTVPSRDRWSHPLHTRLLHCQLNMMSGR